MLKLKSIKSEKIWGYELWIASTHPNGTQKELFEACGNEYPLLAKIIQANDILSIQVHPNDDDAQRIEGKGFSGKTECWYVLDAKPDSKIVYGLKDNYSNEELKNAILNNSLENYLNYVNVKQGDFIFIPSGTIHAIGPGLRLLEIQQSSDITYRLYDWGRGREVHIEKALSVIKNNSLNKINSFENNFECEYFSIDKIDIKGGWSMFCSGENLSKNIQLIYVLSEKFAVIKTSQDKIGQKIISEDIFAVLPGEKITVEGTCQILRIRAK